MNAIAVTRLLYCADIDVAPAKQPTPASKPKGVWRYSTSSKVNLSIVICILVSLGVSAFGVKMLFVARADTWKQQKSSLNNLTLAMERDISRLFSVYDLSVQGIIEVLQDPSLASVSPTIRRSALFDRAASAEHLGSMMVLDSVGDITDSSISPMPNRLNFAFRDYFTAQRDNQNLGLYVSLPFASQLRAGNLSLAISRRLANKDGHFAGVAVGALQLTYFKQLVENLQLGLGGRVALLRMDGRLLARYPAEDTLLGKDFSDTDIVKKVLSSPAGDAIGVAPIDGVKCLVAYRRVGNLPLVLTVSVDLNGIYADWWKRTATIALVLFLLCGSTLSLCLLFRRELQRRLKAERDLRAVADDLATAAETDALTQLGNRRHFEAAFNVEWRRAVRSETELSLLLIDVDKFKLYNDRYGHQKGDEVLRIIARGINDSIRRPADIAARYGGEEFVVILPEINLQGACILADHVRSNIFALNLLHEDNSFGRATISIGVATLTPQLGQDPTELVRLADANLYEAKHAGRNRICGGVKLPLHAISTHQTTKPIAQSTETTMN